MTVKRENAYTGPLFPNGATKVFPFDFHAASEVEVMATLGGLPVDPTLYAVALNLDGTGSISFATAPLNGSGPLYIISAPDFTQEVNFEDQGPFYQSSVNEPIDRSAIRDLALKAMIDRSLLVPLGTPGLSLDPNAAPGVIAWNGLQLYIGTPSLLKGDPGADASATGLFDALSAQIVATGIDKISVTGKSAVGDFMAAQEFVADAGVDATFAAAHPLIAKRTSNGRGFLAATPNVVNWREKAGATAAANTAALQAALNYAGALGRGKLVIHPGNDPANPIQLGGQLVCPDYITVEAVGGARLKQTADEANVFVAGHFNTFIGLDIEGDDRRDPAKPAEPKDPSDTNVCCGIFANTKTGLNITSCRIHNFRSHGIGMRDCKDFTIMGNLIYGSKTKLVSSAGDNGVTTSADISLYSGAEGGRGIIANNHCYSNLGTGISVNINGTDHDIIITGNITWPLDTSAIPWVPIAQANVRGRHGIHFSYHGSVIAGKMLISNNICTNRMNTGIYCAITDPKPVACMIVNNICYNNGFRAPGEAEDTFQGNISLNGAARMMLVANNVCRDFRGQVGSHVGNISYTSSNHNGAPPGFDPITDDGVLICNNICDTSASNGITVHYSPVDHIIVRGNFLKGNYYVDINNQFIGENVAGKITIENNVIERSNVNAPAIWFNDTSGHTYDAYYRHVVRNNRIYGFSKTDPGDTDTGNAGVNAGIRYDGLGYFLVEGNVIENCYHGFFSANPIAGRGRFSDWCVDRNVFENITKAITIRSDSTATIPVCDNIFRGVTTKVSGSGYNIGAWIGQRVGDKVELYGLTNPPSHVSIGTGTWVVGDRVWFDNPAAGAAPGAVCTTAGVGTGATFKSMASLAA